MIRLRVASERMGSICTGPSHEGCYSDASVNITRSPMSIVTT